MKLIESKAEYLPQEEGLEGVYKQIEIAGRTAYHSLDKITPDSAKEFVDRMIKSKHGAALEHGTVYLKLENKAYNAPFDAEYYSIVQKYERNKYSKIIAVPTFVCKNDVGNNVYTNAYYITTNLRVLVENNWLDDLQYLCSPTEFHEKRYTMRFTCSRAIAQELTRHRVFSFLMESQRYINYSKERHGGEITFIKPTWNYKYNDDKFEGAEDWNPYMRVLYQAESSYFEMIGDGCTPQQARDVLPNATKTELIMTGFASDWKFLMDLRLFEKTGAVHPDMKDLMQKAQKAMQEAGIWEDIMSKPSKFE